jgi:hypothetical protein
MAGARVTPGSQKPDVRSQNEKDGDYLWCGSVGNWDVSGRLMILGGTQLVLVAGAVTNVIDEDIGRP